MREVGGVIIFADVLHYFEGLHTTTGSARIATCVCKQTKRMMQYGGKLGNISFSVPIKKIAVTEEKKRFRLTAKSALAAVEIHHVFCI